MHRFAPSSSAILLRVALACSAVWFAVPPAQAQVCEGYIRLATQAEVDAFACAEVRKGLLIGGKDQPSDITNLDGLAGLTTIDGALVIRNNPSLTSLDGLSDLTTVGVYIYIWDNDALPNINGLSGLTAVGHSLYIEHNDALASLNGLSALTAVGGDIRILINPALTSVDGLSALTSLERDLVIGGNTSLTDLNALSGLTAVGGSLEIWLNDALANLGGLINITSIGGRLLLSGNGALTDVDALTGLTSIGGNIGIYNDGGLEIYYNGALTNVDGFAGLTAVEGDLFIIGNTALAACTAGLAGLLTSGGVGVDIDIRDNAPGCNSYWEAIGHGVGTEDEAAEPLVTELAAPYPNPAAGSASLAYTLAEAADVRLTVYDALGRRVAVLAEGPRAAGVYEAVLGAGLPAGPYVVRLEAGGEAWTRRVTLVR